MVDREVIDRLKIKYNFKKLGRATSSRLVSSYDLKYMLERLQEYEDQNKRYREIIKEIHFQASMGETPDYVIEAMVKANEALEESE